MNTTTTPHRDILRLATILNRATRTLAHLNETLTPEAPAQASQPIRPRTRRAAKVKAAKSVGAQSPKNGQPNHRIPPTLMRRISRIERKKVKPPLSVTDKDSIRALLETTTISVKSISQLFNRTPAYIYALARGWGLSTHKGSPALMAGIKRAQKEGRMKGAKVIESVSAPIGQPIIQEV